MTSTYSHLVCMSSNKSILHSLVVCVEFSYYVLGYELVITHYVAQQSMWGCAILNRQSLISLAQQMVSDCRDILD